MKKTILFTLVALSSIGAQACLGEAQIQSAKVYTVESISPEVDVIRIGSLGDFTDNPNCPIDTVEMSQQGIQVSAGSFQAGSNFSGIVAKHEDGTYHRE